MDREQVDLLTQRVIGAFFEVSKALGAGFLEQVYAEALMRKLELAGISAVSQAPFSVFYKGHSVGEYFGDLVVEGSLLGELKCVERLGAAHTAQCVNYLKASGICFVCWLIFSGLRWSGGGWCWGFEYVC